MDSRKHKQQGLCEDGFRLHRREQFRAAVDYVASQFQTDLLAPSGALRIGRSGRGSIWAASLSAPWLQRAQGHWSRRWVDDAGFSIKRGPPAAASSTVAGKDSDRRRPYQVDVLILDPEVSGLGRCCFNRYQG
jgi:hypothetical protein